MKYLFDYTLCLSGSTPGKKTDAVVKKVEASGECAARPKSNEMSVRPPTSFPNTQEMPPPGGYAKASIEIWKFQVGA